MLLRGFAKRIQPAQAWKPHRIARASGTHYLHEPRLKSTSAFSSSHHDTRSQRGQRCDRNNQNRPISRRWMNTAHDSQQGKILVDKSELPNNGGCKAIVTLNNPNKLNILDKETVAQLIEAFEHDLRTDRSIRAVVITGQASSTKTASFCAGANINEMAAISTPEDAEEFIGTVHRLCQAVYTSPAVTICRVDGLCIGAGLELAACCDFRYATERSKFSMREIAIGIPSVVHARLLANIMGWQKAKRLVLLGAVEPASKMYKEGLVDELFADAQAMDKHVDEEVNLLGSFSQGAVESQKRLNRYWEEHDQATGIDRGIFEFGRMFDDGGESVRRYMDEWLQRRKS